MLIPKTAKKRLQAHSITLGAKDWEYLQLVAQCTGVGSVSAAMRFIIAEYRQCNQITRLLSECGAIETEGE